MILYKYRPWGEFTKEIITANKVFFPNREQLNDPSELKHPFVLTEDFYDYSLEKARDKLWTDDTMALAMEMHQLFSSGNAERQLMKYLELTGEEMPVSGKIRPYMHIKDQNLRVIEAVYDKIVSVEKALIFYAVSQVEDAILLYINRDQLLEQLEQKLASVGVLSLTSDDKSATMWANYASNHQGIMLMYDCSTGSTFAGAKKVTYISERPKITPENIGDILTCKYTDWSYEKEYRVLVKDGAKAYAFNASELVGIVLGERMNLDTKREILELLKSNEHKLKIFEAKFSQTEYKVDYFPIND
jgi:hypothetical protein